MAENIYFKSLNLLKAFLCCLLIKRNYTLSNYVQFWLEEVSETLDLKGKFAEPVRRAQIFFLQSFDI